MSTQSLSQLRPEWDLLDSNYTELSLLSMGSTSQVARAKYRPSGEQVAIKMIRIADRPKKLIMREISILKQISAMEGNLPITRLLDVVWASTPKGEEVAFLVNEFMPFSLYSFLEEKVPYGESEVRKILYGLLCSLNFLHSAGVLHRDVNPANILIDEKLNVKLCDFGMARAEVIETRPDSLLKKDVLPPKRKLSTHVVARHYRPPEIILLERNYSTAVDIWSAGCIVAELMKNQTCYQRDLKQSRILFNGDSCYPLSPISGSDFYGHVSQRDQLARILQILGELKPRDTEFLSSKSKHLSTLETDLPPIDFAVEFDLSSLGLTRILGYMLEFNPNRRKFASELLSMQYFDTARCSGKEIEAEKKVKDKYE